MAANTTSNPNHTVRIDIWEPPPLDSWVFSNCSLYAKYALPIYRQAESDYYDVCDPEPDAMYKYLLSGLDRTAPSSRPNYTEAVIWYHYNCDSTRFYRFNTRDLSINPSAEIISRMFTHMEHEGSQDGLALDICKTQLQTEIGIGGNVDIAGVGATISYCLQAPLANVYATAQLVDLLCSRPGSSGPARYCRRLHAVLGPFRATLSTFFWSTVLLCLGTLLASINTLAATSDESLRGMFLAWRNGAENNSFYDVYLAALASAFCTFPVLSTGILLQARGPRRRSLNIAAMVTIFLLLLVVLFWSFDVQMTPDDFTWDSRKIKILRGDIPDPKSPIILTGLIMLLAFFVGGLPTFFVAIRYRWAQEPVPRWGLPRAYKIFISIGMQAFCLVMMWFTLSKLMGLRNAILLTSGNESSMTEWAFGQILALATWIPVVVDISYTCINGIRKGLEAHMPPNYEVMLRSLIRTRNPDIEMAGSSTVGTQTDPLPPDWGDMGSARDTNEACSIGGYTAVSQTDVT